MRRLKGILALVVVATALILPITPVTRQPSDFNISPVKRMVFVDYYWLADEPILIKSENYTYLDDFYEAAPDVITVEINFNGSRSFVNLYKTGYSNYTTVAKTLCGWDIYITHINIFYEMRPMFPDVTCDGYIGVDDILEVAKNFGKSVNDITYP